MSINGGKVSIIYKANRATKFGYCKNNNNGTPRHHKEEKNLRWAKVISGNFDFIFGGVWAHIYNDSLNFSEAICSSVLYASDQEIMNYVYSNSNEFLSCKLKSIEKPERNEAYTFSQWTMKWCTIEET